MGGSGASIATVIGQNVALIMALIVVLSKRQYLHLSFKDSFKPHWETMKNIFKIGLPAMGEQLVMRAGMIIYAKTVASLGTVAYAIHNICMNIQALSFMNGQAFAVSATSLVGQSLGKKARYGPGLQQKDKTFGYVRSDFAGLDIFLLR